MSETITGKPETVALECFSKLQHVIAIRLLRAELSDDIAAAAHVWWIRHHYRLSRPVLSALWSEAKAAADRYRSEGNVHEVCAMIDKQLTEIRLRRQSPCAAPQSM